MKACQVGRLAAAVLACLEHWPSAIGILTGFARVPVFRDSFIEHDSEIPVKLLSRANEESSGGLQEEIGRQPYFHYWKGEPMASKLCSHLFQCSSATGCFASFGIRLLLEIVWACDRMSGFETNSRNSLNNVQPVCHYFGSVVLEQFISMCSRI